MGLEEIAEIRRQLEKTNSTVNAMITRFEVVVDRMNRMGESLSCTTDALRITLDHLDNVLRGDGGDMIGLTGRIDRLEQNAKEKEIQDNRRYAWWSKLTVGSIVAILGLIAEQLVAFFSKKHP